VVRPRPLRRVLCSARIAAHHDDRVPSQRLDRAGRARRPRAEGRARAQARADAGDAPRHSGARPDRRCARAFSGFARADREDRADRSTYQDASLDAEEIFAQSYNEVAAAGSNGPGFDPYIFGAQRRLREAADALAAVEPPEDELDDEHESLVEGLKSLSKGLESVEDYPPGTDLSGPLAQVDGLDEIRVALIGLRAAGYRVDPDAWQLAV